MSKQRDNSSLFFLASKKVKSPLILLDTRCVFSKLSPSVPTIHVQDERVKVKDYLKLDQATSTKLSVNGVNFHVVCKEGYVVYLPC